MRIFRISQSLISEDTIKWWENYSKNLTFNSELEARNWIRSRKKIFVKQHGDLFKVDETEDEKETNAIPVYKVNATKYKIGKARSNIKSHRMTTNNELISAQKQNFATSMGIEFGKKFSPCIYIDNSKIRGFDSIYEDNLQKIISQIKDGVDQAPILIDSGYGIIDGNHRHVAAQKLRIRLVPVIFYYSPKEEMPKELA